MNKEITLSNLLCNIFNHNKSELGMVADYGELLLEAKREEEMFGRDSIRLSELRRMILLQESYV
ncbi:MAG: hypothetical protein WBN51_10450, partial [Gammaproteobacteria bacterium]